MVRAETQSGGSDPDLLNEVVARLRDALSPRAIDGDPYLGRWGDQQWGVRWRAEL